ncbi:MAG TPA: serine/threonine-protein kinase [Polyangiaceae bacterium]|nr:serine/threonine-protein kinase [Polyangiaceae bacterium]
MYPQIFGKYVLEGELARGGMARLMLATLRGAGGFEKKLVVKQIRDELASDDAFVKRFVDEAKTTVALSHPNIVPVYELGVEQGTYYLAMELVEGVSIAELLDDGVLSPEQGAYVGAEVCRALDYAHRRMQVIHRDITPRNVMVDEEGQVKLIDFGIAALANAKNQVFGSPGHMAPEQMEGKPVGPPADLFALGALLMESWSKKAPFRRKRQDDIEAALASPRARPSEIDPRLLPLDDVLVRTLASDPKERPQDADELGRVLRKFLSGLDMGDIARELGARVRVRRAELRAKREAPASKKGDLERPPSRGEMITKTFAARQEVKKWSEPPPSSETRRMENIETIATRPIETPASSPRQPSRTGVWVFIGAALAIFGVGAAYVLRDPPRPTTSPVKTNTVTTVPTVTSTSTTTSTSTGRTTSPTATTTAAPTTSVEVKASGHLALFGDPGTRASVDGVPRGSCPINDVAVEPGERSVTFSFDATGESSGTHVTVKPGEHVKLRADFTGATATVRVTGRF